MEQVLLIGRRGHRHVRVGRIIVFRYTNLSVRAIPLAVAVTAALMFSVA
jgi:hypothetical protein